MRRHLLAICIPALLAACGSARAGQAPDSPPLRELSSRDAVVLGVVEGVTEFLPISSTGHLIIAGDFLGLEDETPLSGADGEPLWLKKPSPSRPEGVPLTLKGAADTYTVVIQAGAILAVVFIFWGRIAGILAGLGGRNAAGLRLLRNIVVACVPAGVLGLALGDFIDRHLFSVQAVIASLVSGAVLMLAAERWRKQRPGAAASRLDPADLTVRQSLGIGFMQCLALWPGMSRSMCTMVGGYFAGLAPARSAEFSFLVGLPILTGAALLKSVKSGPAMIAVLGAPSVILGSLVAAVSAAIAVKFLVGYLSRHGMAAFAFYRILLAAGLSAWLLVG